MYKIVEALLKKKDLIWGKAAPIEEINKAEQKVLMQSSIYV